MASNKKKKRIKYQTNEIWNLFLLLNYPLSTIYFPKRILFVKSEISFKNTFLVCFLRNKYPYQGKKTKNGRRFVYFVFRYACVITSYAWNSLGIRFANVKLGRIPKYYIQRNINIWKTRPIIKECRTLNSELELNSKP